MDTRLDADGQHVLLLDSPAAFNDIPHAFFVYFLPFGQVHFVLFVHFYNYLHEHSVMFMFASDSPCNIPCLVEDLEF